MGFPADISEKALLDCGRCCCICHKFCGFKIELHHIKQSSEGGEDSYENCLPLCLDCHAEVKAYNSKHPKGRKYTEPELKQHRDRWYEKVKNEHLLIIHPDCIDLDRKLFLKIREILPNKGGSIAFIRNHSYTTPFRIEVHDDLEKYKLQCENPDFEFIDSDLESSRCELTDSVESFLNTFGRVAFTIDRCKSDFEIMAIYPHIKYSKPDIYHKAVDDLRQAAHKVCTAYDDLVRLGRRKLAVE
jgi:hypothetical protein